MAFLHQANPRVVVSTGLRQSHLFCRFLRSPFCWRFLGCSRRRCTLVTRLIAWVSWLREVYPVREHFSFLSSRIWLIGLVAVLSVSGYGFSSLAALEQSFCVHTIWLSVFPPRWSPGLGIGTTSYGRHDFFRPRHCSGVSPCWVLLRLHATVSHCSKTDADRSAHHRNCNRSVVSIRAIRARAGLPVRHTFFVPDLAITRRRSDRTQTRCSRDIAEKGNQRNRSLPQLRFFATHMTGISSG